MALPSFMGDGSLKITEAGKLLRIRDCDEREDISFNRSYQNNLLIRAGV